MSGILFSLGNKNFFFVKSSQISQRVSMVLEVAFSFFFKLLICLIDSVQSLMSPFNLLVFIIPGIIVCYLYKY